MNLTTRLSERSRGLTELPARVWVRMVRQLIQILEIFALLYRLLLATFSSLTGMYMIIRETARQIYFTAVQGGVVVGLIALLLGLLVIVYSMQQLARIQGEEYIGQLLVIIVVREVGPLLTALLVLLRSGTAIIVEIGTMGVTRELEALKMMGIDPYRFLGLPRFWGLTISLVGLYVLSTVTAVLGGFLFAQFFAEIYWEGFWVSFLNSLGGPDLVIGFAKVTLFGMIIAAVSLYYGFQARQHWGTVVRQTSQGAVLGLLLCGLVDAFLTSVFYL